MSTIISIGTAVPSHRYQQSQLLGYMEKLYHLSEKEAHKLEMLYQRSGIDTRYSVIDDFDTLGGNSLFPVSDNDDFPLLEARMKIFLEEAPVLAIEAIHQCIDGNCHKEEITHLITVSCTGMSAPGLDIQLMRALGLKADIERTSVNFMGCYAALHALKQADYICKSQPGAKVLLVCVELCTLHFQKEQDMDNIAANLLFADGAAAVLVCGDKADASGLQILDFYSYVDLHGHTDMSWHISSKGFLMTLSSYIPKLIESGFKSLVENALKNLRLNSDDIKHWAIHPGGRKILEVIYKEMEFSNGALDSSYKVLKEYGNMSSPTILFVLKDLWQQKLANGNEKIFGAAFGPGLTMETVVLLHHSPMS